MPSDRDSTHTLSVRWVRCETPAVYIQRALLDSGDLRTECEVGNLELGTWAWDLVSIWDLGSIYFTTWGSLKFKFKLLSDKFEVFMSSSPIVTSHWISNQ